MQPVKLQPGESLVYAQEVAFWDGFVAGAQSAAERAKQRCLDDILAARKPAATPPPTQPEAPNDAQSRPE